MSVFDPSPTYRVASRTENLAMALDLPLSPWANLGNQIQQGATDTFGLGSVLKDFTTPRGVPGTVINPVEEGLRANPITSGLVSGYETARGMIGAPDSLTPMSEDAYKTSEYFRKDVPWDPSMTVDRAAALATQYDVRQARTYYGQKDMLTTLAGGFIGGAIDPVNYVPIFGPGARVAAASKFGYVVGHALIGASEAAINTAVFGALTTPDRARYGEDVSWQAAINNIAFAGVAGGIFGGLAGFLGRQASLRALQADREARFAAETIANTRDTRGVLNDAVAGLVNDGDVRLSPASQSIVERMTTDVNDKRLSARALDAETADVVGTKAGEVVTSPSGVRLAVKPEVVELSTLQQATGALQARDRSGGNAVSAAQIEDIGINLDPLRLMPNIDASQGAPLVGPDNVVDSGNGRVGGIARAYQNYPDRAAAYRQALVDAGHPEAATMQQPVLIQRRTTPLSDAARAQFNADVNAPTTARMSAVELAQLDRGLLDDQTLATLAPGPITSAENRAFVSRFLGHMAQNDRAGLLTPEGTLNADGVRRIENALVAAAYGDVDAAALRKFAEATDDNTRAVVGAMADVAGKWLGLRRAIQRGEVDPAFDMTPELTEGLRKLSGWRDQAAREKRPVGMVIKEGMAQGDMLSGPMPAATKVLVRSFYASDDFTRALGRDTIADQLSRVVDAAMKAGEPDMLGDAYAATKLGVLKSVYNDLSLDSVEAESLGTGTSGLGEAYRGTAPGADRQGNPNGTGENGSGVGSAERAAGAAHLLALAEAGDIEGIKASPELAALVADMRTRPATDTVEGYGTEAWGAERTYTGKDGPIVGIDGAYDYLINNARNLAADELGIPHYEVAKEHKATIIIGPPASGKSTIANELARRLRAAIPDPDEAKKIMPEYDNGMGSNATHEESSFLTNYVIEELTRGGENMVIPKVGGSTKSIEALTQNLKHFGYTVDVVLMNVDPAEAFRRMIGRYVSSGRLIPPDYFDTVSRTPARTFDELKAKGAADGFATVQSPRGLPSRISGGTLKTIDLRDGEAIAGRPGRGNRPADGGGLGTTEQGLSAANENRGLIGRPTVDMQEPRPEPPPDGLDAAAARVGKGEDIKALAEQHGVNPDGTFDEQAQIDQMRADGRLTVDDQAELDAAQRTVDDASAYAEALRAAAACVMG